MKGFTLVTGIAWKNVWRNKIRSLTVISSVAVGVFAGVFSISALNSSIVQRIDAAVNQELSHIQVNSKNFRSGSDIRNTIPNSDSVASLIHSIPGVVEVTDRLIIRGMASTATKSSGVEITGIDIEKEKRMFALHEMVIAGTGDFFKADTKFNSAFIGEKLAKELNIIRFTLTTEALAQLEIEKVPEKVIRKLSPLSGERFTSDKKFSRAIEKRLSAADVSRYGLKIKEAAWSFREGSRIILTFLDNNDIQTGAAFRICGLYRTNNDLFEATSVFVPIQELRELSGMDGSACHRLIGRIEENELTDKVTMAIRQALPMLEVLNWKEIQPDLAMMADMMQQIYGIFMGIILLALAFGIVNTMLMAVLERTKELGMLTAIGMNRRRVFSMIMMESVFLSVTGGLAGMAISSLVIAATARNGINLVRYSEGMEAFGYTAHLYPAIDPPFFLITSLLIVITGILSSVYPARKALKLKPVEAIRTD